MNDTLEIIARQDGTVEITAGIQGDANIEAKVEQPAEIAVEVTAAGPPGPQGKQGPAGADGADGFSPVVSVSSITGGHQVDITDAVQTQTFNIMDGVDGTDGTDGTDGQDGVSPEVTIASITGGHSVTITDADHPGGQSFNVMDGTDGQDGADGADGADGVSPEVTIGTITGGHSVKITDADHPGGQTFNVMDGTNGTNVEWVTYGTATSADIEAAYQAGKIVAVKYSDKVYYLGRRDSSTDHYFCAAIDTRFYVCRCNSNTWSNYYYECLELGDQGTIPSGGNAGQLLAKNSATDYDVHWVNKTQDYPSAYCTTAAATAAKKASCSLWADTANSYLHVLIGQANTSAGAITLNVNSTGAKPVYINGAASSATNYTLPAGSYIVFYDGTNFHFRTDGKLPADISGSAGSAEVIPWGKVDNTSTATVYTATIPGITKLVDGTSFWLKNGVITSASGFTVNINNLGAKKCYSNMTAATQDTTIFNINYTMLFVYDSSLDSGAGGYYIYRGYNSDNNTIGYQLRTNSYSLPMTSIVYRYRLLFQSADNAHWVPANNSTSTNATASRTVCQDKINPFGSIVYYGTTTSVAAGSRPSAAYLWEQYAISLGYSFNRTGAALVLTLWKPVYVKAAPQSDGSAIIDSTTPYVQDLPSTEDGKIYIYLGVAYSATNIELACYHPVYCYKGGHVQLWTNSVPTKSDVGLGNVDNVQQYSASNPPPYPVTSVNGKTGAVSFPVGGVNVYTYGGKDLSTIFASAADLHTAIAAGDFSDIHIGDYWPITLNGSYNDTALYTVPAGTTYYTDENLTTVDGTTTSPKEGAYQSATAVWFYPGGSRRYAALSDCTSGFTKSMNATVKMEVAAINPYIRTGDSPEFTANHVLLCSRDCMPNTMMIRSANSVWFDSTQTNPWRGSHLWETLNNASNGVIKLVEASALGSIIYAGPNSYGMRACVPKMGPGVATPNPVVWIDRGKLFIPAEMEVFGAAAYSQASGYAGGYFAGSLVNQWPIFAGSSRHIIKGVGDGGSRSDWWLATAFNANTFPLVANTSVTGSYSPNASKGVPLCFLIV